MAVAGFCRGCGQYVWLNEQWGCVNGHPWTEISNWYDPATGTPVTPHWLQPQPLPTAAPPPTPAPSDRLALLADVLAALSADPACRAQYGTDTDIVVTGASGPGFSAAMKAVEGETTLHYAEEVDASLGVQGASAVRGIVQDVAMRHGWAVKLVLRREDATW